MNRIRFVKDRAVVIVLNVLCMVFMNLFLLAVGNSQDTVMVILLCWCSILAAYFGVAYYQRQKYLKQLLRMADNLDEKYLISEVMEKPARMEDEVFYQLLRMADKSMLEKVAQTRREKQEYREYIEQWVHEAKTPITAMKLMCENHKESIPKSFLLELEKLNHYVEQALYYARSEQTHKDFLVRETNLEDVIHQAIAENRQLLLQNRVQIKLNPSTLTAYTDGKWIVFILNQIIQNAVKYRNDICVIKFNINQEDDSAILSVTDNGIGISKGELPRIFDKGFTGQNGRDVKHATGMGLYLCRRLCDRLQVGLSAYSDGVCGTTITLTFNRNRLTEVR